MNFIFQLDWNHESDYIIIKLNKTFIKCFMYIYFETNILYDHLVDDDFVDWECEGQL